MGSRPTDGSAYHLAESAQINLHNHLLASRHAAGVQILSNGFTIGCLTAIALHLILPVRLLMCASSQARLLCTPRCDICNDIPRFVLCASCLILALRLQLEEGGEDKYVHAVPQGALRPCRLLGIQSFCSDVSMLIVR